MLMLWQIQALQLARTVKRAARRVLTDYWVAHGREAARKDYRPCERVEHFFYWCTKR